MVDSKCGKAPTDGANIDVVSGTRQAEESSPIAYDLYVPRRDMTAESDVTINPEVVASAVFLHGFACNRSGLAHHARRLAADGLLAMTPDLSSLTQGGSYREILVERTVRSAQLRNVQQVVDHIVWLRSTYAVKQKPFALVGHSAGGAVALEAAVALQEAGQAPSLLVLLDAVPFPATCQVAARLDLRSTKLVSIRAEPSAWNKSGAIEEALMRISREGVDVTQLVDLKIPGARHGDPMESSLALKLLRLIGTGQGIMAQLLDACFADLRANSSSALQEVVDEFSAVGKLLTGRLRVPPPGWSGSVA